METITTPTSLYISYEVSSTNDQKNSLVLSVFRIYSYCSLISCTRKQHSPFQLLYQMNLIYMYETVLGSINMEVN